MPRAKKTAKTVKKATKSVAKRLSAVTESFTKTQLLQYLAESTDLTKKDCAAVLESLGDAINKHVKKRGVGKFTIPGICKIVTQRKPATKARKGINPFTGEEIPIWIANFVLAEYGTGAVMSVPAHDQRDFEFASRFGISIRVVIQPPAEDGLSLTAESLSEAYVDDGVLVDSAEHTAKTSAQARHDIAAEEASREQGVEKVLVSMRCVARYTDLVGVRSLNRI